MIPRTAGLACLTSLMLTACGGGGDAPAAAQGGAVRSTALADQAPPAGFSFAMSRRVASLHSHDIVPQPARFADPRRTYVSLWLTGAGPQRQQLALLTLATLQAMDAHGGLNLTLPADARSLTFEVYDAGGDRNALRGEIVL